MLCMNSFICIVFYCMNILQFIQSAVDGHLGYFLIWSVKSNASINTCTFLLVHTHISLRYVFGDGVAPGLFSVSSIFVIEIVIE